MKNILVTLLLCICVLFSYAQGTADTVYKFGMDSMICKISADAFPNSVFTKVEIPPQFPGGEVAWKRYASEYFKKPKHYEGLVEVWFIVGLDGSTSRFQIIAPRGLTYKEEDKLISFFKNSGKWYPAKQNGYCVVAWNRIKIY